MDPVSITILIILIGIGGVLAKLHIKRFKSGCLSIDCYKSKSRNNSNSSINLDEVVKKSTITYTDV